MISLVVVAAAALVATTAGASSSVYPFPSFTRSMSTLDPYGQSYCFLTGGTGVIQGTGSQQYLGVQPCYYGQIGIYGSELGFGLIGNSASASADLGTVNELGWRYNLTQNAFFSLRYDGGNLVVGQGAETKTLSSSDTDSLLVTESLHTIAPIPGHVYLVRVTEGGSTSNWAASSSSTTRPLPLSRPRRSSGTSSTAPRRLPRPSTRSPPRPRRRWRLEARHWALFSLSFST